MNQMEDLFIEMATKIPEFEDFLRKTSEFMADEILNLCLYDKARFHNAIIQLNLEYDMNRIDHILAKYGLRPLSAIDMLALLKVIYKAIEETYSEFLKQYHYAVPTLQCRILINSSFDGIAIIAPEDYVESVAKVFKVYGIHQLLD
ncbi:MAG: hypothetical protein J5379_00570 [Clostridiales bacterium]|nr:hypothetical protein [Clostridiales bacterium]